MNGFSCPKFKSSLPFASSFVAAKAKVPAPPKIMAPVKIPMANFYFIFSISFLYYIISPTYAEFMQKL